MSHLHRQLAANAAIAADKENVHPCTPTVIAAGELQPGKPVRITLGTKKKAKARRRG